MFGAEVLPSSDRTPPRNFRNERHSLRSWGAPWLNFQPKLLLTWKRYSNGTSTIRADDPHCGAPSSDGDYKHPYWDMVRELKDDQMMASLHGYEAVPILQRILGDLTALGYDSPDEAVDDLEALWDKVKLGANEAPLTAAARMADRFPVTFQTNRLSKKYQKFLRIAYHLQAMRGDDYISLPVVRLGEILSVNPHRVSDYRKFAEADSFLHQVAKPC